MHGCFSDIAESSSPPNADALNCALEYMRRMFHIIHQTASTQIFGSDDATNIIQFFRQLSQLLPNLVQSALHLQMSHQADVLFSLFEFLTMFDITLKCLSDMPDEAHCSFSATVSSEDRSVKS